MAASQLDNGRETQQKREAAHLAIAEFRAEQRGNTRAWKAAWEDDWV